MLRRSQPEGISLSDGICPAREAPLSDEEAMLGKD